LNRFFELKALPAQIFLLATAIYCGILSWHARLSVDYSAAGKTVALFEHSGLRILQNLSRGDGICHNVIVHPPGGLVGRGHAGPAF
jgi:hypothetical protein